MSEICTTNLVLLALLFGSAAAAETPSKHWDYRRPYDDGLLYVHSLINYSYDLQWRYEWERRQLSDNGLRLASGSVAADDLLTDLDININQSLNDKWRFQGRFTRLGMRQQAGSNEQLLLGLERSVSKSSAIYLMFNPQYEKEFIDIAAGYTFYKDNREQYVRVGLLFEDFTFDTKNRERTTSEQEQVALQWQVRLGLGNEWFLYTEAEIGNGYDRIFTLPSYSPDVARHKRRENSAEVRISRVDDEGQGWSAWVEWYDFDEEKQFRQPVFDYVYENRHITVAAEHIRIVGDRHRWRFLLNYVDHQAGSRGFNEHDYNRSDVLGGVFYEFLWPKSGASVAYAFGLPDASFVTADANDGFELDEYSDKIIASWRYRFSQDAQLRLAASHEVSHQGFGGASLQFQMFF